MKELAVISWNTFVSAVVKENWFVPGFPSTVVTMPCHYPLHRWSAEQVSQCVAGPSAQGYSERMLADDCFPLLDRKPQRCRLTVLSCITSVGCHWQLIVTWPRASLSSFGLDQRKLELLSLAVQIDCMTNCKFNWLVFWWISCFIVSVIF